ncbi:CheY chemotaxis protein or a CheY-like REC (receiver) domain [Verrucomicrobium sp. GAS474]|uniref:response regulator n=1 Tax=Verrucomicrobium sp. GAS474 TaxID=1882831 RepID=UPI00087B0AC8|nr:response regulator [Verrucomicrobium sp. GAS474]SDU19709.1 CheY chemotaxis protein or a CheY-like REC (receiver) domain [Verrucomicrobium sp. GAS474]
MPYFSKLDSVSRPDPQRKGILLIDAKGRIAGADSGFSSLLRYDEGEIVGKRYTRLFTPMQIESRAPEIAFFLANKEGCHVGPVWRQQKGENLVPLHSRMEALRDGEGTVGSYLECLQPQPETGSEPAAIACAGEALLLLERKPKERFPRITLAGCDVPWITGWPVSELIGKEWDFLFTDADGSNDPAAADLGRNGLEGETRAILVGAVLGGLSGEGKGRIRRKDGGQVSVFCRIVPLDAGTKPTTRMVMQLSLLPSRPEEGGKSTPLSEVAEVADSIANEFNNLLFMMGESAEATMASAGVKPSRFKHIESSIHRAAALARHLMMIGKEGAVSCLDSETAPEADPESQGPSESSSRDAGTPGGRVPFFPEWSAPAPGSGGKGSAGTPQSQEGGAWPKGTETILIVDDNAPMRRLLAASLRTLGYRVIEVGDRDAAVSVIRGSSPIDLLVADMVLPSGSGRDVAAQYRKTHEHGAVLYISGYSQIPKVEEGEREEAFLSKPFTPLCLARKIREILGPGSLPPQK